MMSHFDQQMAAANARNAADLQKLQRQFDAIKETSRMQTECISKIQHEMSALMGQLRFALEEIETLKDRVSDLEKLKADVIPGTKYYVRKL